MSYDSNNIFAKIIRGDIPTDFIYEDDVAIAFKDLYPKAPVHLLVLPKKDYVDFSDMVNHASPDELSKFMKAIYIVAHENGLVEGGYRVVFNVGPGAGQTVPHLHAHIMAKF